MTTLNDLVRDYHRIEDRLIESGGEITEEIQAMLDEHDAGFDAKKDRYIGLIRSMEASIGAMKEIEAQAKTRRKTLENASEGLRDRLYWGMKEMGLKKARGGLYPANITRKATATVDVDAIPADLHFEMIQNGCLETVNKYDKTEIKKRYADSAFVLHDEKEFITFR